MEEFNPTADGFRAKFKVGVSFVKGTVQVDVKYVEKRPEEYAKISAHGSGVQSSLDVEMSFQLEDVGAETNVKWEADAKVGGMLAGVGSRLVESAAKKNVEQLLQAVRGRLEV